MTSAEAQRRIEDLMATLPPDWPVWSQGQRRVYLDTLVDAAMRLHDHPRDTEPAAP